MSARSLRSGLVTALMYVVLIGISIFMLLPFVWMISTSFKLPEDVFGFPPVLISPRSTLLNYQYLFEQKNLVLIVWNTFFVAATEHTAQPLVLLAGRVRFCQVFVSGQKRAVWPAVGDDDYSQRGNNGAFLCVDALAGLV